MTHTSSRLRAIALDPTPANLAELSALALVVDRMERALDAQVGDAQEDAFLAELVRAEDRVVAGPVGDAP